MGFKLPERMLVLEFEGTAYEGAEIKMRLDMPLGAFLEVQAIQASGDIPALCRIMSSLVVSWNLEDDDGPIPCSYDGMMRLTPGLLNTLIEQWVKGQVSAPVPLGQVSSNGATSSSPESSLTS